MALHTLIGENGWKIVPIVIKTSHLECNNWFLRTTYFAKRLIITQDNDIHLARLTQHKPNLGVHQNLTNHRPPFSSIRLMVRAKEGEILEKNRNRLYNWRPETGTWLKVVHHITLHTINPFNRPKSYTSRHVNELTVVVPCHKGNNPNTRYDSPKR